MTHHFRGFYPQSAVSKAEIPREKVKLEKRYLFQVAARQSRTTVETGTRIQIGMSNPRSCLYDLPGNIKSMSYHYPGWVPKPVKLTLYPKSHKIFHRK